MHRKQINPNEGIHPIQKARDFLKILYFFLYKRMLLFINILLFSRVWYVERVLRINKWFNLYNVVVTKPIKLYEQHTGYLEDWMVVTAEGLRDLELAS